MSRPLEWHYVINSNHNSLIFDIRVVPSSLIRILLIYFKQSNQITYIICQANYDWSPVVQGNLKQLVINRRLS